MHLIHSYFSHYFQLSLIVFIAIIINNRFGPKTKKSKEEINKKLDEQIKSISLFSIPVANFCLCIKAYSDKESKIFHLCFFAIISLIPILRLLILFTSLYELLTGKKMEEE